MSSQALTRQAQAAYGAKAAPVRTHRGTEYAVFANITKRIRASSQRGRDGFNDLASALHDNMRLWTILAVDVADDGNRLPIEMRAQIFSLAEFTRQHTAKILRREAAVDPLIEINVAIMKGLAAREAAA
ncbi:MAG: flagellar biosynthesis regulator FlaF [Pseudomonadota bacterium]